MGLSYAGWASAAVAELEPERFATGSAILATLRQVGAVLGIAVLVALLDAASPTDPVGAFTGAYEAMAFASLVAGGLALLLGRVHALGSAPVPETA